MARNKKEINSITAQIGEVKHSLLMLRNQLEETKKKIKEKEAELEALETKQKYETMKEILIIAEGEGVSLTDVLAALRRDKSLIGLIADEAKNNVDEEEDIVDTAETSGEIAETSDTSIHENPMPING
jgi:septal ring factor EnvC (AmiA/AmiB activator)